MNITGEHQGLFCKKSGPPFFCFCYLVKFKSETFSEHLIIRTIKDALCTKPNKQNKTQNSNQKTVRHDNAVEFSVNRPLVAAK